MLKTSRNRNARREKKRDHESQKREKYCSESISKTTVFLWDLANTKGGGDTGDKEKVAAWNLQSLTGLEGEMRINNDYNS